MGRGLGYVTFQILGLAKYLWNGVAINFNFSVQVGHKTF